MSDHYTTQHNHLKTVKELIRELRHFTFHSQYSLQEYINAKEARIYQHNSYQRLTRYNRSYCAALLDSLFQDIQKSWELRYKMPDGQYYNTSEIFANVESNTEESYQIHLWLCNKEQSQPASFWKNSDKIFSAYTD